MEYQLRRPSSSGTPLLCSRGVFHPLLQLLQLAGEAFFTFGFLAFTLQLVGIGIVAVQPGTGFVHRFGPFDPLFQPAELGEGRAIFGTREGLLNLGRGIGTRRRASKRVCFCRA